MLNNKVYYALAECLYQLYETDKITWEEYERARNELSAARTQAYALAKEWLE
jgi:hypothetical protein